MRINLAIKNRSNIWVGVLACLLWLALATPSRADFIYTVEPGDSAWSIGVHFGISLDDLCKANGWTLDDNPLLQIGQCVAIPTLKDGATGSQAGSSDGKTSSNGTETLYIVQVGDNPFLIAQKYHVTHLALLGYNNLTENDLLTVGQTLKIPPSGYAYQGGAESPDDVLAGSLNGDTLGSGLDSRSLGMKYAVVAGDTLMGIARSNGVSMSELLAVNKLTPEATLHIGQELVIPAYRQVPPAIPSPADSNVGGSEDLSGSIVPLPGLPPSDPTENNSSEIFDFRQIPKPSGPTSPDLQDESKSGQWSVDGKFDDGRAFHKYTIRRGDTVNAVAHAFGVTQNDLMDRNGLDSRSMLRIGRDIKIPLDIQIPAPKSHGKSSKAIQDTFKARGSIGAGEGTRTGRSIIEEAMRHIGTPYVWAGRSLSGGTDCSGFTMSVYSLFGVDLPHSAKDQSTYGSAVDYENLQPGDLVFFHTTRSGISHVGMYIGKGEFIHASSHTGGVTVSPLDSGYYNRRLVCARRVL